MTGPVASAGCETYYPEEKGREARDEQSDLESLRVLGPNVSQGKAPSMTFEVTKYFFDLHTPGIGAFDLGAGSAVMRQGGGK